ncbi:hypothetical protein OF83DRAFT_1137930, partial [Amylostereum chailletii]
VATIIMMYTPGGNHSQRRFVIPVVVVMFIIATWHIVLTFVRATSAFVYQNVQVPGAAGEYYANLAHPLSVMKNVLYATQTSIGDGVLIWRVYVVYGKNKWIALPLVVLFLVNAAVGYIVCWMFSRATPGSTIFHTATIWITTFFVLTMCINVLCTTAIACRIISSLRVTDTLDMGSLVPALVVMVESGALYAGAVLALLIAYLSGSNGQFAAIDLITPLVGIVFSLIVLQIRYHVGRASSHTPHSLTSLNAAAASRRRSRMLSRSGVEAFDGENDYPLRSVKIAGETDTEVHSPMYTPDSTMSTFKVSEVPKGDDKSPEDCSPRRHSFDYSPSLV